MNAKILNVNQAIWWDLIRNSDGNRIEIKTKNIVAPASNIKRTLFVPRSTRSEQGEYKRGRMYDGAYEPNFDPKFSFLFEFTVVG